MRRCFTTQDAYERGITHAALKWGTQAGSWQRLKQGIYLEGKATPTALEQALVVVVSTGGVASGTLAAILHELDGVDLVSPFVTVPPGNRSREKKIRRLELDESSIVEIDGVRCTDGLQTMIDLAPLLDDICWEQALESALRKKLLRIKDFEGPLESLGQSRFKGLSRMRRVLKLRPSGVPPTESLLETLMVQLIRTEPMLPTPLRQVEVSNRDDIFIARVDLAWPDVGIFLELDGQQHKDQPLYDARRETAVVTTTGWLPGRFTWTEVTRIPRSTLRRLVELHRTASTLHFKHHQ